MIKIGGIPVLEHQINLLKNYNIKNIIILTGYLSHVIEDYFKNSNKWGVKISYFNERRPLGTGGGLKKIENQLTDDFIFLSGDVIFNIDLAKLFYFHRKKRSFATLVTHPNDHPRDSDLVETDNNGRIIKLHPKPHKGNRYFRNLVNAGIYVLPPGILKYIRNNKKTALEKEIFPQIIREKRVFGYNSPEYIKDMGTPERLKEVAKDYSKGKVGRLNLRNKRKAIFLDRDGTINYDGGNISKIEDFRLLPKTAEAIKLINTSEYLAVVVTNQPVVAKGFCSISDVEKIHKKMETLLGIKGAKLDAIYFCPHHPDRGYPGENPKYKIKCGCRKPKIGLLKKAQKDLNIDLSKSWIIGDSERDITAGKNAGIRKILIKKNQIKFGECPIKTQTANDIYSAVKLILKKQ